MKEPKKFGWRVTAEVNISDCVVPWLWVFLSALAMRNKKAINSSI